MQRKTQVYYWEMLSDMEICFTAQVFSGGIGGSPIVPLALKGTAMKNAFELSALPVQYI